MGASAVALEMALHYLKHDISYIELYYLTNRATPEIFGNYKLALYKT